MQTDGEDEGRLSEVDEAPDADRMKPLMLTVSFPPPKGRGGAGTLAVLAAAGSSYGGFGPLKYRTVCLKL